MPETPDAIIQVSGDEVQVFLIDCERESTLDEETDTIDASCKANRAMDVMPGRYSGRVAVDALYVPDSTAYQALRDANRNGDLVLLVRSESGVVVEVAYAKIDNISESYPDQSEAVVSLTATLDGFWQEVGS